MTATTSAANNPIMGFIKLLQEANGATTTKKRDKIKCSHIKMQQQ